MGLFDLEKHFAFYGAYHRNPVNILIHMVFVWPIFFTGNMITFFIPMLILPNFSLVVTLLYALFYVGMDKKSGFLAALLCFLCYFGASSLAVSLGFSLTWKVVLAAQLICWISQFIGHGVFEKRAPALLDNLAQAFLMAPFFVLLETLPWYAPIRPPKAFVAELYRVIFLYNKALEHFFGYEPYLGFHAKVKAMVDEEVKEWQEKKKKSS